MFAQLGTIQFDTIKTFGSFSERGSAKYAEHALIDAKPRLQRVGSTLNELSLSIMFHHSFCVPQDELELLKDARDNGEVLPLLWGDGTTEGDFIILDIDATKEEATPEGKALAYSVNVTLKEFVTPNKLQQEQASNRANAKAVGDKKPVVKKQTNADTCPQIISKIISKIENHAAQISKVYLEDGGAGTPVNKDKVRKNNNAIQLLCIDLNKRDADPASCVRQYPTIATNAGNVKDNALTFNLNVVAGNSTADNLSKQNIFIKSLKASAKPLIDQSITRK